MNLFDVSKLKLDIDELEKKTAVEGFWNNSKDSGKVLQQIKSLKNKCNLFDKIISELNNLTELTELLEIEEDIDLANELLKNTKVLQKDLEKFEIQTLLSGKYDNNNAIITLHPGAGGTESQDWVEMLYRMYCRWANSNGYYVKELDYLDGDEARHKKCYSFNIR